MGKSSGGGGRPAGSTTVIQDIAEPFKGFATRSLQRAEDLQGLPAVPFTGIATAPPSPDELVGAQALRNRFMEHGPLSTEALALQRTAADPITAESIQARQNPFQALLAQEAYRRLDERTQQDLQKQRAQEVGAGGFDRGRGAIQDHLIRQRAADQERQIGLEAGQKSFTDAAQLAQADRRARGDAAVGLMGGLGQRQALGRRDIDDLIKVGAQFREQFVQPELGLERQQFTEFRGPGSVMNPFGFEQFFSGIRSAAPTPGITTTQQFKQTPSGIGQMAPLVGTGLQTANQMGAFKAEGGIVDFHEGGLAAHRGADHSHPENDPAVINMVIAVLQEQGHLPPGDQGRIAFMNKMQGDPNFRPLFDQAMAGVIEGSGYVPPSEYDTEVSEDIVVEDQALEDFVPLGQDRAPVDKNPFMHPGGDNPYRKEPGASVTDKIKAASYQAVIEEVERQDKEKARPKEILKEAEVVPQDSNIDWDRINRIKAGALGGVGDDLYQTYRTDALEGTDMIPRNRAIASKFAGYPLVAVEEDFAASVSPPDMDEGFSVGMAEAKPVPGPNNPTGSDDFDLGFATGMNRIPEMVEGRAPFNELSEMVSGRAVSPEAPEASRQYSNAEITAMLDYSHTGRGSERLPKGLRSLNQDDMRRHLEPMRKQWAEKSKDRREKERRERIANRRNFHRNPSAPRDTGSVDINIDDITEFFSFNDGGLASFKIGGFAEALNPMEHTPDKLVREGDPITGMVLDAFGMEDMKKYGQLAYLMGKEDQGWEKPSQWGAREEDDEDLSMTPNEYTQAYQQAQIQAHESNPGLSMSTGGIANFANGKSVYSDAETTFTGKERESKDLENQQVMKAMIIAAGLNPENVQDVAKYMSEGFGRHALTPGYPGRSEELTKAEIRHKTRRGLKDAQNARGTDDGGGGGTDDVPEPAYTDKLMDMYAAFLDEPRTPGYPDRPPLSESQRKSAVISAIAGALQGIRNDPDTGRPDFSGMGAGGSRALDDYMNELETRRKEEIAAREAKRKAILEGVKTTYEMHQALTGAEKNRADAAVALAQAAHPGLPIYEIIAPPLLKGIAEGTLGVSEFQAAVREAVRTLTGKTGTAPGILSEEMLKSAEVQGS